MLFNYDYNYFNINHSETSSMVYQLIRNRATHQNTQNIGTKIILKYSNTQIFK